MAQREMLEVGNSIVDADDEFADGYTNGNLYYYDTNHQVSHPLTSEAIHDFIMENLTDPRATARWNAGFIFGWITTLYENNPECFFTSLVIPERTTEPLQKLLQEA